MSELKNNNDEFATFETIRKLMEEFAEKEEKRGKEYKDFGKYLDSYLKAITQRFHQKGEIGALMLMEQLSKNYDVILDAKKNTQTFLKDQGNVHIDDLENMLVHFKTLKELREDYLKKEDDKKTQEEIKEVIANDQEINALQAEIKLIEKKLELKKKDKEANQVVNKDMVKNWMSSLQEVIQGTKKTSDLGKQILQDMLNSLAKIGINSLMNGIFGKDFDDKLGIKSGFGNLLSGLFSGLFAGWFKASGGHVSGSSPYIVGETGPELFIPNADGYIKTASQTRDMLSGTSGAPALNVNIINQTGHDVKSEQAGARFDGESYIVDVVLKNVRNSQNFRDALKGAVN